MLSLAETQAAIAHTLLSGDVRLAPDSLVGGRNIRHRIDIHLRHFASSLKSALHDKFPATGWLLGGDRMSAVAGAFVRECPPTAPCIAEWGLEFPAFLAARKELREFSYVGSFADLEWKLGRVSIATDSGALGPNALLAAGTDRLPDSVLTLHSGIAHLRATHNVDELIRVYLRDESPKNFTLLSGERLIEVRGARGRFHVDRLDADSFAFRSSLTAGHSISRAAGDALEINPDFDTGRALLQLIDQRLVVSITTEQEDS